MALSPQFLLSNVAKRNCISKLKELPDFLHSDINPKIRASVLIPLFVDNGEIHLLYTLRSSNLKNHSGQVSFPGGKMEKGESIIETALRETEEEIGVTSHSIDVWCEMSSLQGRDKDMFITPVVGVINDLNFDSLKPNLNEVEEIFSVPMSAFCNKTNHAHFKFERMLMPVYLHSKHKIWGITGLITHLFLQCFLPTETYQTDFTRKQYTVEELMPSKL